MPQGTPWHSAIQAIARRQTTAGVFDPVPVVLLDASLEDDVRAAVAREAGIAAQIAFVTVDRAVGALLQVDSGTKTLPPRWWALKPTPGDAWAPAQVAGRALEAIRTLPGCEELRTLLDWKGAEPAPWRALAHAHAVTEVMLRWEAAQADATERPLGLREGGAPEWAPWLVEVWTFVRAGAAPEPSPAERRRRLLQTGGPRSVVAESVLGGTATDLPAGDAALLATVLRAQFLRAVPEQGNAGVELCAAPAYGALRAVETLREALHRVLAAPDGTWPTISPRDVVIYTPQIDVYGPLVDHVFGRRSALPFAPPGTRSDAAEAGETQEQDETNVDDEGTDGDEDDIGEKRPEAGAGSKKVPRAVSLPTLPFRALSLGQSGANPVAHALDVLLDAMIDRLTASRLSTLLSLRPVQAALNLDPETSAEVAGRIHALGSRWSAFPNAADGSADTTPPAALQSIDAGLERAALGRFFPDDALVRVSAGQPPRVASPYPGKEAIDGLGRAAELIARIRNRAAELGRPRTTTEWRTWLHGALDEFAKVGPALAWQRRAVDDALDQSLGPLPAPCAPALATAATRFSVRTLRRLLRKELELGLKGGNPTVESIALVELRPGCARPAKRVCFLGMDDGTFPVSPRRPAWDPMGDADETAMRTRLRRAFSDACAGATEALWISWSARELDRGHEIPPCAPVEELFARLGNKAPGVGARHPWRHDAKLPFEPAFARIGAFEAVSPAPPPSVHQKVLDVDIDVDIEDLVRDLNNAAEGFLRGTLGVYLDKETDALEDIEPLELGNLAQHAVRADLLRLVRHSRFLLQAPPTPERDALRAEWTSEVLASQRGRGDLPVGGAGEAEAFKQLGLAWQSLESWWGGASDGKVTGQEELFVSIALGGERNARVRARPDRVVEGDASMFVDFLTASSLPKKDDRDKHHLRAHLGALVAGCQPSAAGGALVTGRVFGTTKNGGVSPLAQSAPADSLPRLKELVELWLEVRATPTPLTPRMSVAIAAEFVGGDVPDREALALDAHDAFAGDDRGFADRKDPWVKRMFPDFDPRSAMRAHDQNESIDDLALVKAARTVWGPLLPRAGAEASSNDASAAADGENA
jgi:exonuclease V gamma subunit